MTPAARILVAGHRGLGGSAILRNLQARGDTNFVLRTHAELELERQADVEAFFERERRADRVGCADRAAMTATHRELAAGRWFELPLVEQLANVGSEIERTISWRARCAVTVSLCLNLLSRRAHGTAPGPGLEFLRKGSA